MIQTQIVRVLKEKQWLLAKEISDLSNLKICKIHSALKKMLRSELVERKPVKQNKKRAYIYNLTKNQNLKKSFDKIEVDKIEEITSEQLRRLPLN